MKAFWLWVWENRTKVIGYVGAVLAQLGTSGIVSSPKVIAWVAFGSSLCTLAIGHFNDFKARREADAATRENEQ